MSKKPRILQMTRTIKYGDGVGNDVLEMHKLLENSGYNTKIYAEIVDKNVPKGMADTFAHLPKLTDQDLIIYHLSTGADMNKQVGNLPGKKMIVYHNITPGEFFAPFNPAQAERCAEGRGHIALLKDVPGFCLADSPYNLQELRDYGYTCPMEVLPILIPYGDYDKAPNQAVLEKYQGDGYTNILFTGRVAPNKKHEDVIAAFHAYQKYYNPKSRLFLVGSDVNMDTYRKCLNAYVEKLGVKNVVFTGHISFPEILSYYHLADMFLCMSEHEGFCIPLIEAMHFEIPIVAYASTGVVGTLGEGGILLQEKDPMEAAAVMDYVLTHPEVKEQMLANQKKQLEFFAPEKTGAEFLKYVKAFLEA